MDFRDSHVEECTTARKPLQHLRVVEKRKNGVSVFRRDHGRGFIVSARGDRKKYVVGAVRFEKGDRDVLGAELDGGVDSVTTINIFVARRVSRIPLESADQNRAVIPTEAFVADRFPENME